MFLQVQGDIWFIKREEQFFLLDADSGQIYPIEKALGRLIEGSMNGQSLEEIASRVLGILGDDNLERIKEHLLRYPFTSFEEKPFFSLGDSPVSFPKSECGLDERLDFMWLEITPRCNLACIHCYLYSDAEKDTTRLADAHKSYSPREIGVASISRGSSLLDTEDWKMALEQGMEIGCKRVQFTGGEATLHPDLLPLLRFARQIGYETIELYTNATILTKSMCDELKRLEIQVSFSFYSFQPDAHEKITRGKGSWRKTVNNVKTLVSEGIPLRAGVILMEENKSHYEKTADFLKKLGVENVSYDYVRPTGRGQKLTPSYDSSFKDASLIPLAGDGVFKRKIVVAPDGEVYPCILTRDISMGNLFDIPLGDILFSNDRFSCVGCSFLFLRSGRRFYAKPQPWWNLKRRTQVQEKPKRVDDIFYEEIEGEVVLYNPSRGDVHLLNPVAASIFDLCDGNRKVEEIAEEISSITGADFDEVLSDVRKTLEEFQEKELLERNGNLIVSGLL